MKFRKSFWLMAVTVLAMILSSCNIGATPAPTQDLGAIQTQAFNLVLTQVALQNSPTPLPTNTLQPTSTLSAPPTFAAIGGGNSTVTPFAFNTQTSLLTPIPSATSPAAVVGLLPTKNGCNDGIYTGEYPHKSSDQYNYVEVSIGETFEQFFTYINKGTCTWDEGYAFVFQPQLSSPEITGNTITLAKNKLGDYTPPGNSQSFKGIVKAPKTKGDYHAVWKLRDDGGNLFGSAVYLYIRVR